jgi:hypothetical protein
MKETSESARLAARLALHEFLLEQLFANGMLGAPDPLKQWDAFSIGLIERIQFRSTARQGSTEDLLLIQSLTAELAEDFCAKVRAHLSSDMGR